MKKILLTLVLGFLTSAAIAQINVGSSINSPANNAGRLTEDEIAGLKKATTLFVLQKADYPRKADFEKAIASVWKVSKFQIITNEEIEKYAATDGFVFFSFGTAEIDGTNSRGGAKTGTVHLTYDLWNPKLNKKGEVKARYYFARIMLTQNAENIQAVQERFSIFNNEKMLKYMYEEAHLDNWGAGYLTGYLKLINDLLMKGETRGKFTEDENDKALLAMRRDTLFVPDYVNQRITNNPFGGNEKDDEADAKSIKEVYHHPIKFLSATELDQKILNAERPFSYIIYVRTGIDKFVTVYNTTAGMTYTRHTHLSRNFKYKDLGKLDDAMKP